MPDSTTVRVSRTTRDGLRRLANDDDVTLDEEITRLVRAERQRRIGLALSANEPDADARAWLDVGASTVGPVRAGDVVVVNFGLPAGGEPGFSRPGVVVTADLILQARPRTIHVVPVTGNTSRSLPTEIVVATGGLDRPSAAQCHLCTVVSVERLTDDDLGNIGPVALAEVRSILGDLLDIR